MRSKQALQDAMDILDRALAGDADACIKIWEIINEPGIDDEKQAEIIKKVDADIKRYADIDG